MALALRPPGRLPRNVWERPARTAALAGTLYFALSAGWILGSTRIAADIAPSLPALEHAELWKGGLFALATALFFGLVLYVLLRRLTAASSAVANAQRALVQAERRALGGMLASAFAHDCNNLLTLLRAQVSELGEARVEGSHDEADALQRDASATLEQVSETLRRFVRSGQRGAIEPLRPTDVVADVTAVLRLTLPYLQERGCRLEFHTSARRIGAEADAGLLRQAVVNLILNAADVAKWIGVRVGAVTGGVWVEVEDDGPGIPERERERVFESFYTTKRGGAGLGLASVRFAAEAHGGSVEIGESARGGARIRMLLPVSPPPDAPARKLDDEPAG
jgi:signal transduction histidine kinase